MAEAPKMPPKIRKEGDNKPVKILPEGQYTLSEGYLEKLPEEKDSK